jgi:hypothetical protein
MAALIEDLGERFDLEVLDLETSDLGLTARLRVRSPDSAEHQASAPAPARHLRVVPVGDWD